MILLQEGQDEELNQAIAWLEAQGYHCHHDERSGGYLSWETCCTKYVATGIGVGAWTAQNHRCYWRIDRYTREEFGAPPCWRTEGAPVTCEAENGELLDFIGTETERCHKTCDQAPAKAKTQTEGMPSHYLRLVVDGQPMDLANMCIETAQDLDVAKYEVATINAQIRLIVHIWHSMSSACDNIRHKYKNKETAFVEVFNHRYDKIVSMPMRIDDANDDEGYATLIGNAQLDTILKTGGE